MALDWGGDTMSREEDASAKKTDNVLLSNKFISLTPLPLHKDIHGIAANAKCTVHTIHPGVRLQRAAAFLWPNLYRTHWNTIIALTNARHVLLLRPRVRLTFRLRTPSTEWRCCLVYSLAARLLHRTSTTKLCYKFTCKLTDWRPRWWLS